MSTIFTPRKFEAIVDEFGLDDWPDFSGTFQVQSLKKGKIYTEKDPKYIDGNRSGVVIDDNSCWWHFGTDSFSKRFKQI